MHPQPCQPLAGKHIEVSPPLSGIAWKKSHGGLGISCQESLPYFSAHFKCAWTDGCTQPHQELCRIGSHGLYRGFDHAGSEPPPPCMGSRNQRLVTVTNQQGQAICSQYHAGCGRLPSPGSIGFGQFGNPVSSNCRAVDLAEPSRHGCDGGNHPAAIFRHVSRIIAAVVPKVEA